MSVELGLDACRKQYSQDLEAQTHCCVLTQINNEHRKRNQEVFEQLYRFQQDIDAHGTLPFRSASSSSSSPLKKHGSKDDKKQKIQYPEHLTVQSHRELKQVLPIPDIHKTSDCDSIYRFLIARRFEVPAAVNDILHFIAFREKYNLNNILWDRELECMFNGLDGEELLREVMETVKSKGGPDVVEKKKIKVVQRQPLQAGWAAWNSGVDRQGHVVLYQRPNGKELAYLESRFKFVENSYDFRDPEFYAVTAPYTNLLVRLYLRNIEKGRRISRLLNYKQQHIIRAGLRVPQQQQHASSSSSSSFIDNGGGVTCLIDVGAVKVAHVTSSKCNDAFKLFKLLSVMGQSFYPENMHSMIIVNGGFVFNLLFKMVKPWLDPQTQKKIILLSATNKSTVESMSASTAALPSPLSPVHSAGSPVTREDSEETESHGTESGSNGGSLKPNEEGLALRKALLEYIDDKFIPAWYGGRLPLVEAPLTYGGGAPPKYLVENPLYEYARRKLTTKVLPEVMSDAFVFNHAEEGMPITDSEWEAFCAEKRSELFN